MSLDYSLWLDGRNAEQGVALRTGNFEVPMIRGALALLGERPVVLDVGANIGFYTCPLGLKCRAEGGRVFAFEPVRANVRRLKQNLKLNGLTRETVRVFGFALGEEPGNHLIHIEPQGDTNNAVCDFMTGAADRDNMRKEGWRRERIEVRRLDDWARMAGVRNIDFVKMDVEGAELKVLRGGRSTVEKFRPIVLGEFNAYWMRQAGESLADAAAWFAELDYLFCREEGDGFRELSGSDLWATEPEGFPMYLSVPREKREWAGQRVAIMRADL